MSGQEQHNTPKPVSSPLRSSAHGLFKQPPSGTAEFDEDKAKEVIQSFSDEMVPRMLLSVERRQTARIGEGEDFTSYYTVTKGVYVKMSVVRAEPALGDQIMKCDHWEGNQIVKDAPALEGAPNFRRIPGTILFGVGQPSYEGLYRMKQILSSGKHVDYSSETAANDISSMADAGADQQSRPDRGHHSSNLKESGLRKEMTMDDGAFNRLVWINLREEPVIYIDGIPYAPRDRSTLNVNLEHLIGIEGYDLEKMEQRLKADITAKAKAEENKIEIVRQNEKMENVRETLTYTPGTIFTPKEIYTRIGEIIPVQYARVPITDECAPQERDFEELVFLLKDLVLITNSSITDTKVAVIFNCQMGRGRTTTGIVCAYLIMYVHTTHLENSLLEQWKNVEKKQRDGVDYNDGHYTVIKQLVSLLPNGEYIKYQVDKAIDACSQVQNLREAINECREIWLKGGKDAQKYHARGINYLERYWWLIVFNAYLAEEAPVGFKQSFPEWMKGRWGFKRLLKKLELQ
ncbi:hypothetical protein PROFUN_02210 [Planoprotostelium fungivorum]|uniref:Paladin-like n=1 Tax=Planoprotostelium fungivorum TaxID=1890364 RepID=A0A2P6NZF0_9EUKA|nr:hypothetical protein PROFUN_02210 [Planoprotostelium fungivorum]